MGSYTPPPTLVVVITPGRLGTRAAIVVSESVLGRDTGVPVGRLALHMVDADLVGLTPPAATLKALRHVVRTLAHMVSAEGRPEAPAPPDGGHRGEYVNVPLTGLELSTLT